MAEKKYIIFEADIKVDEAVAETARLKEEVTKLHFETEKLKRSQGETSEAYIKSKATLDNANKSLKQHENIVKTVVAQNNQNTESVGKFDDVTKNATKRLREINVEMANMAAKGEQNTEKFRQLQQEGGHLRDSLDEVRARIKLYASDTRQLDQAIMVFKGIGAAAQIAEGASALLGTENEELTKSIQKMVAIQSVLNGLQEIQNLLQKESGLMILANSVNMKAMAAAQAIYTTAVGTSTGAMKLFRTALLATGIGAIIAGIAALVLNWDKLTSVINKSSKEAEKYAKELDNITKLHDINAQFDKFALDIMKERGAIASDLTKKELELNKNRQNDIKKEIELLQQIGLTKGRNEEQEKKYNELYSELISKQDDAILLRIKLENQLNSEAEKNKQEEIKRIKERNDAYLKYLDEKYKSETDAYVKQAQLENQRIMLEQEIADRQAEIKEAARRLAKEQDEKAKNDEKQRRLQALEDDFNNRYEIAQRDIFSAIELESQKNMLLYEQEMANAEKTGADKLLIIDKYQQMELDLERAKTDAKLALASSFMGGISQLFDQGTAVGKAAAVADTLINTYRGAQAAFAQTPGGIGIKVSAATLSTAIGLKNVQKILATKKGSGGGGGSASSSVASAPIANAVAPTISSSAIAGQAATSPAQTTSNAVSGQIQSTVAVVVDDVTAKQNQQLANTKLSTV